MICNNILRKKYFFLSISLNILLVVLLIDKMITPETNIMVDDYFLTNDFNTLKKITDDYFATRKSLNLSALGKYLFLNEAAPPKRTKEFKILVWKHGPIIEPRHLYYFGSTRHEPFDNCSVDNCILTYKDSAVKDAHAVIIQLHSTSGLPELPDLKAPRPAGQRWVFISDESPLNTFYYRSNNWFDYEGIFNWSMTYRAESDVPVPYGRTVALDKVVELDDTMDFTSKFQALVPNAKIKRRDVLVGVLMSNCEPYRVNYLVELQKYITVDIYGACGSDLRSDCPGSFGDDCPHLDQYLFYLAFENSRCNEYTTEKTFNHGYRKGAVPILLGPMEADCRLLLPPDSFLNVLEFPKPVDLAEWLLHINSTFEENFLRLHEWRRHFRVLNEHGYSGQPSYHYCRLCEALNYNDETTKIYDRKELAKFFDPELNCFED